MKMMKYLLLFCVIYFFVGCSKRAELKTFCDDLKFELVKEIPSYFIISQYRIIEKRKKENIEFLFNMSCIADNESDASNKFSLYSKCMKKSFDAIKKRNSNDYVLITPSQYWVVNNVAKGVDKLSISISYKIRTIKYRNQEGVLYSIEYYDLKGNFQKRELFENEKLVGIEAKE
ncbi:MAG: hypothetical protein COA79_22275 [Planctomycetota bacterium]|nr:MAG: hypothetical protein COA79_22275 [Planctomycetota bacterium]